MGRHFDALVELVKKDYVTQDDRFKASRKGIEDCNVKEYLERLVKKAALFDFPLNAEEIFPRSGKDFNEYVKYVQDYFDMSHQYKDSLLMPFPNTAIEDKVSVVLFDPLGADEYIVTTCNLGSPPIGFDKLVSIIIGDVKLEKPDCDLRLGVKASVLFGTSLVDGIRMDHICKNHPLYHKSMLDDLGTATISYTEQLIYIMDPGNFIIRKESNASMGQKKCFKQSKKKKGFSQKTFMRPHYVCINADEVKNFLQSESKEPRPAHPVRGHWRKLMSERFVNKQGQTIFVKQHWTGDGKVQGKDGWNYQIFIKEGPTIIKPFS